MNTSILSLSTDYLVNIDLLCNDSLSKRIQMIVEQFQITAPNSFLTTISLIRQIIGRNSLLSGTRNNWLVDTPNAIIDVGWM